MWFSSLLSRPSPLPVVLYVLGPTASGKTSFTISLAHSLEDRGYQTAVISADARQIYEEIPIFSGAVSSHEQEGITHYVVGSETLKRRRTAAWFTQTATTLITSLQKSQTLPVVVGGSGFWLQSLLFQDDYPQVEPDPSLRQELTGLPLPALQERLERLDPKRSRTIDQENPRRLIRAIEIATALGHVPEMSFTPQTSHRPLLVWFDYPKAVSDRQISQGVSERFARGLLEEAEGLRAELSLELCSELGLAYKHLHRYWRGELSRADLVREAIREEKRYAKRQRTFFKKMMSRLDQRDIAQVTRPEEREEALRFILERV